VPPRASRRNQRLPDAPAEAHGPDGLPIQPVSRPILCKPYDEPDRHWLYDTTTGAASESPRDPQLLGGELAQLAGTVA